MFTLSPAVRARTTVPLRWAVGSSSHSSLSRKRRAASIASIIDAHPISAPLPPSRGGAWSGTVTLKLATDQQGAADDNLSNMSYRFSSPESLDAIHRLRCASDAVLVGMKHCEIK